MPGVARGIEKTKQFRILNFEEKMLNIVLNLYIL